MRETKRITIDGETYELRPWSPADGQRWLFLMLELAGKLRATASAELPMGLMLAAFPAATMQALWDTVRRYAHRVRKDGADEAIIDLETLETRKGDPEGTPYVALLMLTRQTMELEYGDFFSRLPSLLGPGPDGSRSKSPPASAGGSSGSR